MPSCETFFRRMSGLRISRVRAELRRRKLDALLISAQPHVRYLTGFTGSNGICLFRPRAVTLFTDSRYSVQAIREVSSGVTCRIVYSDLMVAVASTLSRFHGKRVGFESDHLSVSTLNNLRRHVRNAKLRGQKEVMETIMATKEACEVESIREAAGISDKVFESLLDSVRAGVAELDVSAEISFLHRKYGAEGDAFEPIVAAGRRSALPHARATRNIIRDKDIVLLDFGCIVNGYVSDISRTIVVGSASRRIRALHAVVLEAGLTARRRIRPGVRADVIDGIARDFLAKAGLARYFVHSLGHGIGLSVHERPRISPASKDRLVAGNVLTIEPGVYIPFLGGIRIEDDILVTAEGHEVLSTAERNLLVL